MLRREYEEKRYVKNKIMMASSLELISYTYDAALKACNRQDKIKSIEALELLIKFIRFEHEEIALLFYRIYKQILEEVYKNNYDVAAETLRNMKKLWNSWPKGKK